MTQKPPPTRHRFRLKNPTQTPSNQNRNPLQPDAKPPPTRQAKRNKRTNRSADRPLEAATTESNNEQSERVYDLDDVKGTLIHIVGPNGVCTRCGSPAQPGLGCQPTATSTSEDRPVSLLDYAGTRLRSCEEQIRLAEWAYENGLNYGGSDDREPRESEW